MYNDEEGTDIDSTHSRQIEVRRMVTETIVIPEGYIRFSEAVERYKVLAPHLSRLVSQGRVRMVKHSHKMRFVNEADILRELPPRNQ